MYKYISTKEQNIHISLEKYKQAWNTHDAKAFAAMFTADADFTNVFGQHFHGREAIEAQHVPIFATMFKESNIHFLKTGVRFISHELAAVDVVWNMSGAKDFKGNAWPDRKGLMNVILRAGGNDWLILVMHNMDLPAAPMPGFTKPVNGSMMKASL